MIVLIHCPAGRSQHDMHVSRDELAGLGSRHDAELLARPGGGCLRNPTDPVLSAVIVKGKFADHNIPKDLQNLIVAESGEKYGLGYPFLFFALYLIKYVGAGASQGGAVVGWLVLYWAEKRNYVDRESFLVFAISLALFVLGTCGLIGTDDVLACFVAGNVFTWDDWFRIQTLDDLSFLNSK